MKPQQILTRSVGRFNQNLHRLPMVGEPLVRGLNRNLGKIFFYSPLTFFKRADTIGEVKKFLIRLCDQFGISIDITKVEDDSLEFFVNKCPYGYCQSDQLGVCDAAMDLDRVLFRLSGAELIIQESIVSGAPKCRILLRRIQ